MVLIAYENEAERSQVGRGEATPPSQGDAALSTSRVTATAT